MKKVYSFLLIAFSFFLTSYLCCGQPRYFFQDFEGGSGISTYIGSSANLFTQLTTSGAGANVSILSDGANNRLKLSRVSGNQARFGRSVGLAATPPEYLYVQFKVQVNSTAPVTNTANFYIGGNNVGINSFTDNGAIPTASYASLQFNFVNTATGGVGFRIDSPNNDQSAVYGSGEHLITWILNNSTDRVEYAIPDAAGNNSGAKGVINRDKMILYIDGELQFGREVSVNNTADNMNYFKFLFSQGTGDIIIDELNFRGRNNFPESVLPVSLLHFGATPLDNQSVELRWATASEHNSSHFVVERSASLENFSSIARLDAAGFSASLRQYAFTDHNPLNGTSYYRLRQVDTDGTEQTYRPVAVQISSSLVKIFPNPSPSGEFVLQLSSGTPACIELLTPLGQQVPFLHEICDTHQRKLRLPTQPPAGVYTLRIKQADGTVSHHKLIVP